MDTLPDEILLKLFRYLDLLDLGECVMVSKRFQRICHDRSLDYKENYAIPNLYKGSTSCYLKDLILHGEYEKAKKFYQKRWTNQWHLEDSVTFELRRRFINRLALAMMASPEQEREQGEYLHAYAKAIEIEKTMYSIASTKKSYYHLIAESIYKYYHITNATNFESESNEIPSFGIEQDIIKRINDTVTALPNERIKSWHDGCVSPKIRDHMVQLTVQAPIGSWSEGFILNPLYIDLISWAANLECDFHTNATSKAEYFRLMALNIYEVQMKVVERIANQDQDDHGVLGVPVVNGFPVLPGLPGIINVHSIPKGVYRAQVDRRLKEPNYNQVYVVRKFVRPSNFVKGLRRKFFHFSDDHLIKKDGDLAQNPAKVCFQCMPIKNIWPKLGSGIEETGKPIKNKVNLQCNLCYQLATFHTSRIRRKTKPKKLLNASSLNNVGPNRAFIGFEDSKAQWV